MLELAGAVGGLPWAAKLSQRERQVAQYVAHGASNKEISAALLITEKTVEKHVSRIFRKLGFSSRAQLAVHIASGKAV